MSKFSTGALSQLPRFVERILSLKEQQDLLSNGIREVYAEVHAAGLDKQVTGQVVNCSRKREKDPARFAEKTELFERYLKVCEQGSFAYSQANAGKKAAPRLRRAPDVTAARPSTGHRIQDTAKADGSTDARDPRESATLPLAEHFRPSVLTGQPDAQDADNHEARGQVSHAHAREEAAREVVKTRARAGRRTIESRSALKPPEAVDCAERQDRPTSAFLPLPEDPEPPATFPKGKPYDLRPHCLKPEMCGGYGRFTCKTCLRAAEEQSA